jgi:hypothetical protein
MQLLIGGKLRALSRGCIRISRPPRIQRVSCSRRSVVVGSERWDTWAWIWRDPKIGLPGGSSDRSCICVLDYLLTTIFFFLQYPMQLIFAFMIWRSYPDHGYGAAHVCWTTLSFFSQYPDAADLRIHAIDGTEIMAWSCSCLLDYDFFSFLWYHAARFVSTLQMMDDDSY